MNSGDQLTKRLESLAMEITDETRIDWSSETEERLRSMQLIDEVFRAHSSLETPPDAAEEPLFRWGALQVQELVAEGGFGQVYRAFDPRLQRTVALKLRRDDAPGTARQWIEEARCLARVQHPHVLTVHDAATHDDRPGIATEWIEGATLEDRLVEYGPSAAGEVARVGIDLCRALSAVHRADLVHGDVKTTNVMRDADGRTVLMDFGSARAAGQPASGTPLFAAPEVLNGETATPRSDVYSVGALLYRLLSARDPYAAVSLEDLRQQHAAGPPPELSRAIPSALSKTVMSALSIDPADRPASTAELGEQLARGFLRRPRRWRWGVAAVGLLLAGLWFLPGRDGLVTVHQSDLLQVRGGIDLPLGADETLAVGDHLALRFAAGEDVHVYVLNEDAAGETFLLFPAPHIDQQNPLAGGATHRLPGTMRGESFDWVVTKVAGAETFLVVASREPVELLESEVNTLATASPDRTPAYVRVGESTLRHLRSVGGMAPTSDTQSPSAGRLVQIARALQESTGDAGLWVKAWRVGGTD